MAAKFFVDLHMVNVSADPHPEGTYEHLLRRAFTRRLPIKIRGERFAIMTSLGWDKSKETGTRVAARGIISTFTDIDVDAPWLNRKTGKAADNDDTNKIVIPESLRPHFSEFRFYFNLEKHILVFQGRARMPRRAGGFKKYALTPLLMKTYLNILFMDPEVLGEIDSINVTVIPDPSKLDEILGSKDIRELTLVLTVPNSDNIATERGQVRKRFREMQVKRRVATYTATKSDGIKPDNELAKDARVCALDGEVSAKVKTLSGVVPLSTSDTPLTERIEIDTNIEPEETAIWRAVKRMAKRFKAA